jgi:hypothetical protein
MSRNAVILRIRYQVSHPYRITHGVLSCEFDVSEEIFSSFKLELVVGGGGLK